MLGIGGALGRVYGGKHFTFEDQLAVLKSRGLSCNDDDVAIEILGYVSYFSFGDWYLEPFITGFDSKGKPKYDPSYSFDDATRLYEFDSELKNLCLEVLRVFELKLRTQVAYQLGKKGAYAHLARGRHLAANPEDYAKWLARYTKLIKDEKRKDGLVRNYMASQPKGAGVPIWVAIEALDFGAVEHLYKMLDRGDKAAIKASFPTLSPYKFDNLIERFRVLRNICSHHNPLWSTKGGPKNLGLPYYLDPLCDFAKDMIECVGWRAYTKVHLQTFNKPIGKAVTLGKMGFAPGWEKQGVWK